MKKRGTIFALFKATAQEGPQSAICECFENTLGRYLPADIQLSRSQEYWEERPNLMVSYWDDESIFSSRGRNV